MFTGIVEKTGTILRREPLERGLRMTISVTFAGGPPTVGESVAVDGACMTVTTASADAFSFEASAESLRRTTLGGRCAGERVNLERALTLADRIGGHLVSGHVDGTGRIVSITPEGESAVYEFEAEATVCQLVIEKGSIAVDGISLTCFHCRPNGFDVAVIPHTAAATTLGAKRPGDRVNLEADMIAKYVAKLVGPYVESRS
jgi:riboflavin synthase